MASEHELLLLRAQYRPSNERPANLKVLGFSWLARHRGDSRHGPSRHLVDIFGGRSETPTVTSNQFLGLAPQAKQAGTEVTVDFFLGGEPRLTAFSIVANC
jgi:hypothetical protein